MEDNLDYQDLMKLDKELNKNNVPQKEVFFSVGFEKFKIKDNKPYIMDQYTKQWKLLDQNNLFDLGDRHKK